MSASTRRSNWSFTICSFTESWPTHSAPRHFSTVNCPMSQRIPKVAETQGRLPMPEQIQELGSGPPDIVLPEFPPYRRMIQSVFDSIGWDPREFHGFRLRMRFPPIPTLGVLRYELP